ncbi:MAG: NAD(+) diphosphatase [Actinomycetota bacterium]|nr:NAD(+) diphosphatase [Actinomycetota bacterium]
MTDCGAEHVAAPEFSIGTPVLSRGAADRDELLRSPQRILLDWPAARILAVGPTGEVAVDGDRPSWQPAVGDGPPAAAVLLGAVDGIAHWAVPDPNVRGPTLRELGAALGDADAGLVVTAVALLGWHARGAFCPACGGRSTAAAAGWSRSCPQGHQEFPRTDPAVIVLVHDGADNMVLARQPIWAPGRFSVLAGFNEAGESLEATVVREIGEEIGVAVTDIRYLGSQPWPFPRSLMLGFSARAEPGLEFQPRDGEIEEARWVSREAVRRMLGGSGWGAAPGDPDRAVDGIVLPGSISIAHRMIQGWAAGG